MDKCIELVPSGIPFLDQNWGGVYRGATYVVHGPPKSGRTLTGLQFASQAAASDEVCVYLTNIRPRNLIIHAASMGIVG